MKLILYHFESCPYCELVRTTISALDIPNVEYRDIQKEPLFKEELIQMNGKKQVPCLVIDGKPMLESADIVTFLKSTFGSAN